MLTRQLAWHPRAGARVTCWADLEGLYTRVTLRTPTCALDSVYAVSTKRSRLPPVTAEDVEQAPEKVRATPNGGHAWRCHYCGAYASSVTARGLYVCRRHGGSTARQRGEAKTDSLDVARPPGRPITTGAGSRGPRLSIDEIVEQYREAKVDIDATDNHMLYLRAHLADALSERESDEVIEGLLRSLAEGSDRLAGFLARQKTVTDVLDVDATVYELSQFAALLRGGARRLKRFMAVTAEIERRYERLIRLSTVRAKTKRANAAAHQLEEFAALVPQVLALLEPRLDEGTRLRLVARLRQEFSSVPARALDRNTLQALPATEVRPVRGPETVIDAIAGWLRDRGTAMDDPETDTLYLEAYLQSMESLVSMAYLAQTSLEDVQDSLPRFLSAFGFGKDGSAMQVRDVLAEYRLGAELKWLEKKVEETIDRLHRFGPNVEKRHTRLIELGLVRAVGRDQARQAGEATLQRHLVRRLHAVLVDVLEPADLAYVDTRVLDVEAPLSLPDSSASEEVQPVTGKRRHSKTRK